MAKKDFNSVQVGEIFTRFNLAAVSYRKVSECEINKAGKSVIYSSLTNPDEIGTSVIVRSSAGVRVHEADPFSVMDYAAAAGNLLDDSLIAQATEKMVYAEVKNSGVTIGTIKEACSRNMISFSHGTISSTSSFTIGEEAVDIQDPNKPTALEVMLLVDLYFGQCKQAKMKSHRRKGRGLSA